MEDKKIPKYFNAKQLECMAIAAKNEYIIASRGFGKSEGIDAPRLIRNVFAMPRSSGALLSPTYGKLLRNTLPAIFHALDRLGYRRGYHYFIGKRAPKVLNFKSPYIDPFDYDYVIHWFNGSIQHLISFDRPMSANSMSLDYIMGFEAKFLDYDKIKNEVLPANRGNLNYFSDCPWHHGQIYTSDMPTNKSGSWLLEKEKDMDKELIEVIKSVYFEIKHLESLEMHDSNRYRQLRKELDIYRSNATFYAEYNVFDNLEILGEEWIASMKRDLPPLIFNTAILNRKLGKIENGFYSGLNEKIHCYTSYNNLYLENQEYQFEGTNDCRADGDLDPTQPLCIANDYNAAINTMVTAQVIGRNLKTLKSFYVKTPRKLKELIEDWCEYYAPHRNHNKDVIYYYDSTAIADTPLDARSFADTVKDVLTKYGWNVIDAYIGKQMAHHMKHNYIDLGFKGDPNYLFPLFNSDNNEYLLLAMNNTGVKIDRNGFQKDKSAEKDPDTPENPDEKKTHITDAWDTLFIGSNFYQPYFDSAVNTSTNWGK